ncbi:MAG: hypothetical protein JWN39_3823 [Ilumatobacteraceae bacterium]|nr:hypothetical protein [Ilumatobacteraceae bacterium]
MQIAASLPAPRPAPTGYDSGLSAAERRRTGAWYTPPALVAHVVANAVGEVRPGEVVSVLDPACGDGRFLLAAASAIEAQGGVALLTGVDIDLGGLRAAGISASSAPVIEAIEADALDHDWGDRRFDVVVGNPPFLSQLASATARRGRSRFGGGPYADAAADFLALSVRSATERGGRVGLVLPLALLTARDAGPIRSSATADADLEWFWWSDDAMFDASVRTCAVGLRRGGHADRSPVRRASGSGFDGLPAVSPPPTSANEHWGWLIADVHGVPEVPAVRSTSTIADHALVTANFRDQYYGLVGAVSDEGDGPPLITTGLIDAGACHWGSRPTRFAKQAFAAPRVDRTGLAPFMQRWADRCLVPKVLVATQTRVLEAVVDEHGAWLPAVPVVRLVPHLDLEPVSVWEVAAVLTSPVASALIAGQSVGSGLSATTMRVSQRTLGALPWPAGPLALAVAALRSGDLIGCGRMVDAAYGVDDVTLLRWWRDGLSHQGVPSGISSV